MEERIKEILLHYGSMATKQIEVTEDDSILYEATQAILTAVAEKLPSAVDEDGSQGKWVNGWNDYRNEVLAQLGKEEK